MAEERRRFKLPTSEGRYLEEMRGLSETVDPGFEVIGNQSVQRGHPRENGPGPIAREFLRFGRSFMVGWVLNMTWRILHLIRLIDHDWFNFGTGTKECLICGTVRAT